MKYFISIIVICGMSFALGCAGPSSNIPKHNYAGQVVRVFSVDGGGIRGIVPAYLLSQIEESTGKQISEIFQSGGGTSTGGILTIGLTTPGPDGKAKYTAAQMVEFYEQQGPVIFFNQPGVNWSEQTGYTKYGWQSIEGVLQGVLGNTLLSQAVIPILITTWTPEIFNGTLWSSMPVAGEITVEQPEGSLALPTSKLKEYNLGCPAAQIAHATASAPGYFSPTVLSCQEPYPPLIANFAPKGFSDGGQLANDPSALVYQDAQLRFPGATIYVYSFGCGTPQSLQAQALEQQLNANGEQRFFRVNAEISELSPIDNAMSININYLLGTARKAAHSDAFKAALKSLQESL